MHDKYKRRHRGTGADRAARCKIATEAAKRLLAGIGEADPRAYLREAPEAAFYAAKRRAAAVLGRTVRPGDLPSDEEVRAQVLALADAGYRAAPADAGEAGEDEAVEPAGRLAERLDRFDVYRLRLSPLEGVKQDPRWHPEGDALYHSLQVFERAREARPFDEEFLLAALLHDVGKAIDPRDHVAAGLESLRGALPDRTAWLIEHHRLMYAHRDKTLGPAARRELESSEWFEDLALLRELDEAGRVPGAPVGTVEEALAYLKGLEEESYLEGGPPSP